MKLNPFKFLLLIIIVTFTSCDWLNTDEVELSSSANFVSLKFAANDSIPNIETAVFTLEWDAEMNDSVIVNIDSLPYNTRIDSIFPTFGFSSTSSAYILLTKTTGVGFDTVAITGKDTIDFTRVDSVKNFAADGIAYKTFPIKVNVHKVNGNLYLWNMINDGNSLKALVNQKAIMFNDSVFYYYMGSSVNNYLYSSLDGKNWNQKTVVNLPLGCNFSNMQYYNGKLYLLNKDQDLSSVANQIYTSSDGVNWVLNDFSSKSYSFVNFLFEFNNSLYTITKSKSSSVYSIRAYNGTSWNDTPIKDLTSNFPIEGFAATSFTSKSMKQKAIVVGGYSATGNLLKNVWSTENGSYWIDFSTENKTLASNSGASIVAYDNKLILIGGMDDERNLIKTNYMQSLDDGLSWGKNDTINNVLFDADLDYTYKPRAYQSVIVKSKLLYLFGGVDKATIYNDVWRGKLNRLFFKRQ